MACVAGSRYQAKVGLVRDYDNLWDSVVDAWHGRVERESGKGFLSCQRKHTPFDFCYLDHMKAEELSKYQVLFYLMQPMLTQQMTDKLTAYVEQGAVWCWAAAPGIRMRRENV